MQHETLVLLNFVLWSLFFVGQVQVQSTKYKAQSTSKLFKTLQRLCFVIVSVENGQQFRNNQQILNSIREIQQFNLATSTLKSRVIGNQLADTARVYVLNAAEIQQDLLLALVRKIPDRITQRNTAVTNSYFTTQIENGDVSSLSFFQIQLSHGFLRSISALYLKLLSASASLS